MSKHLTIILQRMCAVVDIKHGKIDFKEEDWFLKAKWSQDDQDAFRDWLIEYMKGNSEARRELMSISSTRVKFIKDFSNSFVFQYGWRLK